MKRPSHGGRFVYRCTSDHSAAAITQNGNRCLSTGRAESFVPMKSLVGLAMVFPENLYLLHFAIVFFNDGKEFKKPGFK
jgi:hypothetical protein